MSYGVENIIRVQTNIRGSGLGFANFGAAAYFPTKAEVDAAVASAGTITPGSYKEYFDAADVLTDGFLSTDETYIVVSKWLGGIPTGRSITIYFNDQATIDVSGVSTMLNDARNLFWWYWGFFDKAFVDVTATGNTDVVNAIAGHADGSDPWYFMNCANEATEVAKIRNAADSTDISSFLTSSGYRHASTLASLTDPYAGVAAAKWAASVNYAVANSTITLEGKRLSGVIAENLPNAEYAAMKLNTKKCCFYSVVDLQGQTDAGRLINTRSHSVFGEWIDDVVNLDAFVNTLSVTLDNVVNNRPTKLGQDITGQATLIGAAKAVCEQYINNRYLGERIYTDPDDGIEKFTRGYEILTKPEDILDISDQARDDRESAPIRIRIFRLGAIQAVDVTVDVY